METQEALKSRSSVRHYSARPVPKEDLTKLVKFAGLAPSPHNEQMWHFKVVTNDKTKGEMAQVVLKELDRLFSSGSPDATTVEQIKKFSTFFKDAPVVIAVLMKPYRSVISRVLDDIEMTHAEVNELRGHPDIQAIGAAIENLLLAATDMGYGSCWLSGPMVARKSLEELLEVSEPWRMEALVTVGHPTVKPKARTRKDVDEIVTFLE